MDRRIDRREFLRRSVLGGAAIPFAGGLLGACSGSAADAPPTAWAGGFSPLPLYADNPRVAGGLPVEHGTLRVYEWKDYLSKHVLDSFTWAYRHQNVRVEVQSFLHVDEAISRLQEPDADYDVFFPTVDVLPELVEARLLLPLNHDYLPNIRNLWPQFRAIDAPFYDRGQRYTLPYTVYSSGIGWRRDLIDAADTPEELADPFEVFWNDQYRGRVGMYDDYLEAMSLALLRDGIVDVRAADDEELRAAADALAEAVRRVGVRFTTDGAEEGLAAGEFVVHQAWSGDVLTARRYADDPGVVSELAYWSPPDRERIVGCDLTAICTRGRNPILAHAFLDHLLRFDVAMDNFSWNGYQPPLEGVSPESFADPSFPWRDAVPPNLGGAILSAEEFDRGQMLVGFGPSERARWLTQWNRVVPSA